MPYKEKYPLNPTPHGDSTKEAVLKNREEIKTIGNAISMQPKGGGSGLRQRILYGKNNGGKYSFLSGDGLSVIIDGSAIPVVLTLADGFNENGAKDYVETINKKISAWTLPGNATSYLFVERSISGALSYDSVTVKPIFANALSSGIPVGSHVFNTLEQKMYMYNGVGWKSVVRVFIAAVTTNKTSITKIEYMNNAAAVEITEGEKEKLSGIAEGAEVNQNAFAKVKIGNKTFLAAVKQAILELVAGDNILLSLENNKVAISSNCLPSSGGVLTGDVINESKYVKNAKSIDATATGAGEDEETIVMARDKNGQDLGCINILRHKSNKNVQLRNRVINKNWSDFRLIQTDDGKYWCELVGGAGTTLSISPNSNNNTIPTTEWINTFIGNYIMRGASATSNGAAGIVPEPKKGQQSKYFRADGTWSMPTDTTYSTATQTKDGLMSFSDKKILDAVNTNPWLLDYLSRFGYNYVPPVQNAARIKLGVFKSFYNKFVLKNQPTQYGHLLSLPDAYNGVECFEIWISAPDGTIYTRAGNASKAINDQQFLKLINAKEFTETIAARITWKKAFTGNAVGNNVNLCTLPATWNEMYIVYKHNQVEYISSGVINKAQKGVTIWTLADDEDKAIRYTVNASNEVILISRGQGNSSIKEVWYR